MNHSKEQFSRLYLEHSRNLLGYIITLVGNRSEAEDVLQNVCVVLWEKFDEFEPGTNFLAWARRIAYLKVLEHHRLGRGQAKLLRERFFQVADAAYTTAKDDGHLLKERLALRACSEKLHHRDREIIACVYERNLSLKNTAAELGRPTNTVYKAMSRIRRTLAECVRRALRNEGN